MESSSEYLAAGWRGPRSVRVPHTVAVAVRCSMPGRPFVEHTWRKMLSSRNRAACITWEAFERIKQRNPLPRPKLRLSYSDLQRCTVL